VAVVARRQPLVEPAALAAVVTQHRVRAAELVQLIFATLQILSIYYRQEAVAVAVRPQLVNKVSWALVRAAAFIMVTQVMA
jgi:predicted transcriptional regulator